MLINTRFKNFLIALTLIGLSAGCTSLPDIANWSVPFRYKICLNGAAELKDLKSGKIDIFRIPHYFSGKTGKSYILPLPDVSKLVDNGRALLEFESIAGDVEIYINGKKIKAIPRSSSFESQKIDITEAIKNDKSKFLNILVRPPKSSSTFISRGFRWGNYIYGIPGNLFLCIEPKVLTEEIKIETSVQTKKIKVIAWLSNHSSKSVRVTWQPTVHDQWDKILDIPAQNVELRPGKTRKLSSEIAWEDPVLWGYRPYGRPKLYILKSTLVSTDKPPLNKTFDIREDRFGFREIWSEGNKILFNGEPAFFRFGLLGPMYGSHRQYFISLFKAYRAIQFDSLRFSLENHTGGQAVFNLADETGFLLKPMFYLGHGKVFHHTHQLTETEKQELIRLYRKTIRRYWNHPSLMWIYVDNEFASGGENNQLKLRDIALEMKKDDPTRILEHGGDLTMLTLKNKGKYPELELWSVRSGGKNYLNSIKKMMHHYQYKKDIPLVNDEIYYGGFLFDDGTSIPFFLNNDDIVINHTAKLGDYYGKTIKGLYDLGFQSVGPCYGAGPFFTYIQPGRPVMFPFGVMSNRSKVKIRWPSASGEDAQLNEKTISSNHGFFNWFDQTRPEFYVSIMARKIARAILDLDCQIPPLSLKSPEAIAVVADDKGEPIPDAIVMEQKMESAYVYGVRTDSRGTAWFVPYSYGIYLFSVLNQPMNRKIVRLKYRPKQRPGYSHIQWVQMGNTRKLIIKLIKELIKPADIIHYNESEDPPPPPYTGPRNLIAHWIGNETEDNPVSLKAMGAKEYQLKGMGNKNYLMFDGMTEIIVPYPKSLNKMHSGFMTVAAWINTEEYGRGLLMKQDGGAMPNFNLSINSEGHPVFGGRFGSTFSSTPGLRSKIPKDQWVHICVTADGQKVCIYVNGKLDISHPKSGLIRNNKDRFVLGKSLPGKRSKSFLGKMSDIKIYNYPLSENEVRDLHLHSIETTWNK